MGHTATSATVRASAWGRTAKPPDRAARQAPCSGQPHTHRPAHTRSPVPVTVTHGHNCSRRAIHARYTKHAGRQGANHHKADRTYQVKPWFFGTNHSH